MASGPMVAHQPSTSIGIGRDKGQPGSSVLPRSRADVGWLIVHATHSMQPRTSFMAPEADRTMPKSLFFHLSLFLTLWRWPCYELIFLGCFYSTGGAQHLFCTAWSPRLRRDSHLGALGDEIVDVSLQYVAIDPKLPSGARGSVAVNSSTVAAALKGKNSWGRKQRSLAQSSNIVSVPIGSRGVPNFRSPSIS